MTREKARPLCLLKQMWVEMFDENCVNVRNPDDEYQGLLMLLETALSRTKYISTNQSSMKSTCEKHIAELQWKTQECNKLKSEVNRLETMKCHKCSMLETELLHYKKQSVEAQNRIKSIANILKLGDNIEEVQGQRKNSAMTLVSQMLLEESPKRKKRHLSADTPVKKIIINDSCDGVIPETVLPVFTELTEPVKGEPIGKLDIITSPEEKSITFPGVSTAVKILKDRTSKSINLPVSSIRKSPRKIKRNLTNDFLIKKTLVESPKKKMEINKKSHDQDSLNGSLLDYVKDVNSELDKIWFGNINPELDNKGIKQTNTKDEEVMEETPEQNNSKKHVWKMKGLRGPSEISGSKKLRQMKLNLGVKSKEVDLCSLEGYDGGSSTSTDNVMVPSFSGKVKDNSLEPKETDTLCSENFKPEATSTQRNEGPEKKRSTGKTNGSPNYKYKRNAVRKKADRMKLDGWDCVECAQYYGAVELSPSKVKARMNKCSRHRDKFDPHNDTPPDFWNPIFPDTEECREKRLYVSLRCQKGDIYKD